MSNQPELPLPKSITPVEFSARTFDWPNEWCMRAKEILHGFGILERMERRVIRNAWLMLGIFAVINLGLSLGHQWPWQQVATMFVRSMLGVSVIAVVFAALEWYVLSVPFRQQVVMHIVEILLFYRKSDDIWQANYFVEERQDYDHEAIAAAKAKIAQWGGTPDELWVLQKIFPEITPLVNQYHIAISAKLDT